MATKEQVDSAELLRSVLAQVAPGTALRDGLERILRGSTGALIVLGQDKTINAISSGGFDVNINFSATRLRELVPQQCNCCRIRGYPLMNKVRAIARLIVCPANQTCL